MKKLIIGSILFSIILFFMINFVFSQRTDPYVNRINFTDGLIHLKGWVVYNNNYPESTYGKKTIDTGIICELKDKSKYEVHSLIFGNRKYKTANNLVYSIYSLPFNCSVGQVLELKIALKKKGVIGVVPKPEYYTIATFRVKNLFKSYIFPAHGQVIDLNVNRFIPLVFKWKFTNFPEWNRLQIFGLGTPSIFGEVNGESFKVKKNLLKHGVDYNIKHHTALQNKDSKFKFPRWVTSDSAIYFRNTYSTKFKTKKLLILKKIPTIR